MASLDLRMVVEDEPSDFHVCSIHCRDRQTLYPLHINVPIQHNVKKYTVPVVCEQIILWTFVHVHCTVYECTVHGHVLRLVKYTDVPTLC